VGFSSLRLTTIRFGDVMLMEVIARPYVLMVVSIRARALSCKIRLVFLLIVVVICMWETLAMEIWYFTAT